MQFGVEAAEGDEAHRAPVDQHLISHWLSTNADWRIISSWRELLLLALYCASPRSSGFGWG
jgi:hypothetical protein